MFARDDISTPEMPNSTEYINQYFKLKTVESQNFSKNLLFNNTNFFQVKILVNVFRRDWHLWYSYDRERAFERLGGCQNVTTVSTAMGESKSVISRLKMQSKAKILWKCMPMFVKGLSHLKRSICFTSGEKVQKFHSQSDSCWSCNRYRYTYFCQNPSTPIKSSLFV